MRQEIFMVQRMVAAAVAARFTGYSRKEAGSLARSTVLPEEVVTGLILWPE